MLSVPYCSHDFSFAKLNAHVTPAEFQHVSFQINVHLMLRICKENFNLECNAF